MEQIANFGNAIYQTIATFPGDYVLSSVLMGLFVLVLLGQFNLISKSLAPALMTSLGILGTFWGILIALYPLDFSPDEINASIHSLLSGMKTAFFTSLLGLGFFIIFRILWSLSFKSSGLSLFPEHKDIKKSIHRIFLLMSVLQK